MPIYAYRCARCGHELDTLQRLSEPALVDCPACGEPALSKLVTAAGFQLKGSGWYATDFRNSAKPAAKKDAPAADASAAASSESKTDAKPAASPSSDSSGAEAKADAKPSAPASSASSGGGSGGTTH